VTVLRRRGSGPAVACVVAVVILAAATAAADVTVEKQDGRVDVGIDGEPFTSYVHAGHRKPILFPVRGPGGTRMTRSWPIVADVPGEAHDHPHHESIWFTHGLVNGVDFWASHPRADKPERGGGGQGGRDGGAAPLGEGQGHGGVHRHHEARVRR